MAYTQAPILAFKLLDDRGRVTCSLIAFVVAGLCHSPQHSFVLSTTVP